MPLSEPPPSPPPEPAVETHDAHDLRARTIRTVTWVVTRMVVVASLQLVSVAVLSRVLEPEAFGLVSIVFITLMLCDVFSQCGMDQVVVRTGGKIDDLLDAAWSLRLCRGLFIAGLVMLFAHPVAAFQRSEALVPLFFAAAAVPILDGLQSMGPTLLGRALAQGRNTIIDIAAVVVSVATGITLALVLRSAWALVVNAIIYSALRVIGSYLVHPHRPRFTRRWGPLRPHLRYGFYFSLSAGIYYVVTAADRFLVGRFLGLPTLGAYERSATLSTFGISQLPRLFAATAYPSLAKTLADPSRFRRNTLRFLRSTGLLCALISIGLILLASPIVTIVLGPTYADSVPVFRILALLTLTRGLVHAADVVLDLKAKANWRFHGYLAQFAAMALLLPLWIRSHGMIGAAWSVIASTTLGAAIAVYYSFRVLREAEAGVGTTEEDQPAPARTSDPAHEPEATSTLVES